VFHSDTEITHLDLVGKGLMIMTNREFYSHINEMEMACENIKAANFEMKQGFKPRASQKF